MRILFILAFLSQFAFAKFPRQIAHEVENDIRTDIAQSQEGFYSRMPAPRLQVRIDAALNQALDVANEELIKKGYPQLARAVAHEWRATYGASLFALSGIGAHKPVWQWLATTYDNIEGVLGRDFCISTHIADIKTINYTVPVVFTPCTFNMDGIEGLRSEEYKNHFCGASSQTSEVYHGLVPVVVYWTVYLGCDAATSGVGFMFVCGFASGIGEQITSNEIAPGLSDDVYSHFCSTSQ